VTQETKTRLEKELVVAKKNLAESSIAQGEACGIKCDWHDNAAFDFAQRETERNQVLVKRIEVELLRPKITPIRTETDVVGVGNKVVIKLIGQEREFTLLTEVDSVTKPEWLSVESQVGKKIKGKPVGKIDDNLEIVKIMAGEFI